MIDRDTHPVEWVLWLDELSEAHEHLDRLLKAAAEDPEFEEERFRIDLGHIYAHLNRSWHRRNLDRALTEEEWDIASGFPSDVAPVG